MSHGIHHVTAIAGPARRTLAFHTGVLGQRLVKRTVNFDDPGTHHLYYGDRDGAPGSVLTVFPWEHAAPGRPGAGETGETAFRVPAEALPFWAERLRKAGVAVEAVEERFGEAVLPFRDPDGMRLALVGTPQIAETTAWLPEDIGADAALRGFHGVTLVLPDTAATAAVLTDVMGFASAGRDGTRERFTAPGAAMGRHVDLIAAPGLPRARQGAGSVHHVAFRAADDAAQAAMTRRLVEGHGLAVTAQKDRSYFRSVYLREPGGVIFEIATDGPGFTADEPADALGQALKLPPHLEPARTRIEAALPALGR